MKTKNNKRTLLRYIQNKKTKQNPTLQNKTNKDLHCETRKLSV